MIDLERPPVAQRPFPDPTGLRHATLIAARQATKKPARRLRRAVLVLAVAALVVAALFGAVQRMRPTPQFAAPPSVTVTPLPDAAVETDVGPATAVQIKTATRPCLAGTGQAPARHTLLARRVGDGTVVTTALVLGLTDGTAISCQTSGKTLMMSTLDDDRAAARGTAVVVGSAGSWTVAEEAGVVERSAAVVSVDDRARTVDVVSKSADGTETRFRGQVHKRLGLGPGDAPRSDAG